MTHNANEIGWWGQRWLTHLLAHLPEAPTEAQLKNAARATARLRAEKGRVEAHVAGQHGREEVAVLRVRPLPEKDWKRLLQSLDQDRTLRLLSGQFGPELEDAFTALDLQLFPPQTTIKCSCRGEGCRHLHALLLGGMTLLGSNPYLWLEVLGRSRADLQAALQARVTDAQQPDQPETLTTDRFWETEVDPDAIPVSSGDTAAAPDSLLRRLGPLPLPPDSTYVEMHITRTLGRGEQAHPVLTRVARPVDEVLRDYVRYIGEATRALTTGEMPPQYAAEALPGKPVPLAARVLPEVEHALRQEGALLSIEQIVPRCPTAAALPNNLGKTAVADALPQLPPDMLTLGRRYAGPRTAALEGRAFRHIITFDEWRRGRLSTDADWHRALTAAGAAPDLPPGLWDELRPETGDALWLTVAETGGPYLQAEILHRRSRRPGLDSANVTAARTLLRHMAETNQWGIPEQEAVAVLMAEGHYARREHQDEAWLLPFQVQGVTPDRNQRIFTRESAAWLPTFGRQPYHGWAELEAALHGLPELTARTIRWWTQTWPGAQDRPSTMPTLGALLEFLWIKAPRTAYRQAIQAERVPGALADWFRHLEERFPAVAGLYAPHIHLCGCGELYEHRLLTLPEPGAPEEETMAWIVEGYRWIGAERCWDVNSR